MSEERPQPLVHADVDLRGLGGFMLRTDRLLSSELIVLGTPAQCWAAVLLWCRAWQQKPAASLPNDERILASFSGAGKRWPKVRDVAMRGFILCADNRWYHRVLAEEAIEAWDRRVKFRARSDKANRAKQGLLQGDHQGDLIGGLQGDLEGNEGKGREVEVKGHKPFAPSALAAGATHLPPKMNGHRIGFDFETKKFTGIETADTLRWQSAYPALAIPVEIEKAAAWLVANPANRKKNVERYLVNWFSKGQDRAPRVQLQGRNR